MSSREKPSRAMLSSAVTSLEQPPRTRTALRWRGRSGQFAKSGYPYFPSTGLTREANKLGGKNTCGATISAEWGRGRVLLVRHVMNMLVPRIAPVPFARLFSKDS